MRILVVEDDTVSRRILQRAVEQGGHVCWTAESGLAGWELLQQQEIDVVLSDWMMPGMDGIELCRRVRGAESARYIYVILTTALDDKVHFLEGMEAGADDYIAKPVDPDQLRARLMAAARVLSLHQRLASQNAELQDLNERLAESARTDPLTGLGNRLRLWEDLEAAQSSLERYGYRYAVAMCDLDHFKAYNDGYGHPAGDEALQRVAQTLAGHCRTSDRAYRYGGEEFLVILTAQAADGATTAMNRMREAVRELAIPHAGNAPHGFMTISIGIAVAEPGVRSTASDWVANADASLYEAKEGGRNRVVVHGSRAGGARG